MYITAKQGLKLTASGGFCGWMDNATFSYYLLETDNTLKTLITKVGVQSAADKALADMDAILITSEENAKFMGGLLTLGDKIAVHFYFTLSDRIVNDENAYVLFTLADGSTKEVPVSQAKVETTTIRGTTMYVFTCEVNAKEMTDIITSRNRFRR